MIFYYRNIIKREMDKEFEKFIISILSRSNLSSKTLERFTNYKSMSLFRQAFTHESVSPTLNFQYLELNGDPFINLIASNYVRNRFPKVISLEWLVEMAHNLQSKLTLPLLAKKLGFEKYVRVSGTFSEGEYNIILEDVFEAFIGVISTILDKGAAYAVSYEIVSSLYDNINIKLDNNIFNPITRLKEIFDKEVWGEPLVYTTKEFGNFKTKIYRRVLDKEKMLISEGVGITSEIATKTASLNGLTILAKQGIKERIRNPFVQREEKNIVTRLEKPASIPHGFKNICKKVFRYAGIIDEEINNFLSPPQLQLLRTSLVSPNYSPTYNNNLLKFKGDSTVDFILVGYITLKSTLRKEGILTKIKHSITKGYIYPKFAKKFGLVEYALLAEEMKEEEREHGFLCRAFIGAFTHVINSKYGMGVGEELAYQLMTKFFDEEKLNVSTSVIDDPITSLKEMYTQRGWIFNPPGDKSIKHALSEDGIYTVTIYGGNGRILASATGRTLKETKIKAARLGIENLKNRF